jgi:hypothetical protein
MFAPLNEYIEMRLEEAFCKEYRVMSAHDRPTHEWEDYKKMYADWMVSEFTKDTTFHPRHPHNSYWERENDNNGIT